MSKQKLQKAANKLFAIHKLEKLYMTSDQQGFTQKQRAQSHAQNLKDNKVYTFEPFEENNTSDEDTDRAALVVQYEEIFDVAPGHNWKTATIKSKIDAKLKAPVAPVVEKTPVAPVVEKTPVAPVVEKTPVAPEVSEASNDNKE